MTEADEAASEARINRLIELYQRATGNTVAGNSSIVVQAGSAWLTAALMVTTVVSTLCCGISAGMMFGIQRDLARAEADAREIRDYYQVTHRRLPQMQQALDELLKEKADGTDHSGR